MERFSLSPQLEQKMAKRVARREPFVVMPGGKNQKNPRLYALAPFLRKKTLMRRIMKQHKPWLKRWEGKRRPKLGPIGSKPLELKSALSRTDIYGED